VLAVLAFHTGALSAGWVGVDLFFVLSGFLITGLLLSEHERAGRISLRGFWVRRARRLLPGLAMLLALVAVFAVTTPGTWVPPAVSDVLGSASYSANWVRVVGEVGYWDQFRLPGPLEHTWSLAVEEQFYLVWPLVVIPILTRWGRRGLTWAAGIGVILLGSLQFVLAAGGADIERIYVGTDTRAPAFLLGAWCVLALDGQHHQRSGEREPRSAQWGLGLALVGLATACVVLDGNSRATYMGPLLVTSAFGALAVTFAARLHCDTGWSRVVTALPLRWIGRWSYGIYLFHWPLVVVLRGWQVPPSIRFAVVVALSTGLAALSYELVEHPIRLGRVRLAALVPAAATATVVAALVAVTVTGPAALANERLDDTDVAELLAPLAAADTDTSAPAQPSTSPASTSTLIAESTIASGRAESATSEYVPTADAPEAVPPRRPDRILVLGDSVPYHLRSALEAAADQSGLQLAVRAAPGCIPSPDSVDQIRVENNEVCAALSANLGRDLATYRPGMLVAYYGLSGPEVRWNGKVFPSCTPNGRVALTEQLERMLDASEHAGVTMALVPPLEPPAVDWIQRGPQVDGWRCYLDTYDKFLTEHPEVVLVPIVELLCPQLRCRSELYGVRLFEDGIHYSDAGAQLIAPWLLNEFVSSIP
jgi:peptidoglycan/LPS O-acetylase OafA/YrhL